MDKATQDTYLQLLLTEKKVASHEVNTEKEDSIL